MLYDVAHGFSLFGRCARQLCNATHGPTLKSAALVIADGCCLPQ